MTNADGLLIVLLVAVAMAIALLVALLLRKPDAGLSAMRNGWKRHCAANSARAAASCARRSMPSP